MKYAGSSWIGSEAPSQLQARGGCRSARNASPEVVHRGRKPLSPSGVRKDFQQTLAELRTDLNDFTREDSPCPRASGYQMAKSSFANELQTQRALWDDGPFEAWPFAEIASMAPLTPARDSVLLMLRAGQKVAL